MINPVGSEALEELLDPVSQCLTPDAARLLVQLRAGSGAQQRVEELADKCTAGELTPEEQAEYEARVWAGEFIAVLQAKARHLLSREGAA